METEQAVKVMNVTSDSVSAVKETEQDSVQIRAGVVCSHRWQGRPLRM
jgi:hypothetical protein